MRLQSLLYTAFASTVLLMGCQETIESNPTTFSIWEDSNSNDASLTNQETQIRTFFHLPLIANYFVHDLPVTKLSTLPFKTMEVVLKEEQIIIHGEWEPLNL